MRRRHRQIDESVRLMSLSENVVVFSKQGCDAALVVRIQLIPRTQALAVLYCE